MPSSCTYTSSLGRLVEQAKWEFGLPDGARRLIAAGDFDGRDNETLVAWLNSDLLLSGRLLRWCNTPLFGAATPYLSLDEVISVMDRRELARLALLAFVRSLFAGGKVGDGSQPDRLWSHSIAVGTVAAMVSRTCGACDPSTAMVAGTLHDIGLCAHQRLSPKSFSAVCAEVDTVSATHEVEQDLLGWDHSQWGAAILDQWGMSAPICQAALKHHVAGSASGDEHAETICCVALANFLCSRSGWSSIGFHNLPAPGNDVLDRLGINSGLLAVIWQQVGDCLTMASKLS